ncbi:hypothetical protein G7046_g6271 [Stylonectria norvegica]|nr:hypothetical protein G7046_g6271 [Stylonectria norvegica]
MATIAEPHRPTVKLTQGTVVGVRLSDNLPRPVEAFRGIPYALPPTGDRRFRPAVKVEESSDIIDAGQYGPVAPGVGPNANFNEDCLTANVFLQSLERRDADALLPVAIYIHGGGFVIGSSLMHDTASMVAWSENPFVAVSFNYRLGALGFLSSSISAKEGVLNLGLRDQTVLFEWVYDNIHRFGGDPENVTLVGLCSGAHSIGYHLGHFEENRRPLFQKAILESGASTSRRIQYPDTLIQEQQFREFLKETGCPDGTPESEIFPYLRSQPIENITSAQTKVFMKYFPSLQLTFQPVIDGDIIPRPPQETWRQGTWHKVPIMTGFSRNEGSIYIHNKGLSESSDFVSFFSKALPHLSSEDLASLDTLYSDPTRYPDSPYKETREGAGAQYKRIETAYGHYLYVAPVRQTAEFASATMTLPVYLYQWGLQSSVLGGASHGDNIRYEVCDKEVMKISSAQETLARTMNLYITNFITRGDPNATPGTLADMPRWETYKKEDPRAMVFGAKNEELIGGAAGITCELLVDDWGRKECEFWWSKVDVFQ